MPARRAGSSRVALRRVARTGSPLDAPELAYLRVPLLVLSIAVTACGQAVLVGTWQLLTLTQDRDVFSAAARAITVIVMPVAASVACGVAALLMTVMRALLVQATAQRVELATVV